MKPKNHKLNCKCFICKALRGELKGKNHSQWKGNLATSRKNFLCKNKKCTNTVCYRTYKFGSGLCRLCANRQKFEKVETMPSYKDGRCLKQYYCNCGNKIAVKSGLYKTGLCRNCAQKKKIFSPLHKKNLSLAKGGTGISGENRTYPVEFYDLRVQIRKRDNYTCQMSGMSQKQHFKKYETDLTVHHIDYDKKNCKESNLITLSKSWNIKVNKNRKYWTKYFKELINENYR